MLKGDSKLLRLDIPLNDKYLGVTDVSNLKYIAQEAERYVEENQLVIMEFAKRLMS